jgi:hypothetical protein
MASLTPHFFYRVNIDKSIDSICGCCYRTVATASNEGALHVSEDSHDCKGWNQ